MKRGSTGLCGVLAIDKPAGVTSHDVVDAVRRLLGERRVGHAGTLDPMATGLMLVCVGPATRLSNYLTGHDKTYRARVVFGAATDTDDAEGRVTTAYTGKEPGLGLDALRDVDPREVLQGMVGEFMQLPPAYSAIKKNGVTAYKAAREGKDLELEPRAVTVHEAELLESGFVEVSLDDGKGGIFESALPYWDVRFSVSKGTYIRSIARDLGQQLGCGAHLGALRRISSCALYGKDEANIHVNCACSLEGLFAAWNGGAGALPWIDPTKALGYPLLQLTEKEVSAVECGRPLGNREGFAEGLHVSLVDKEKLLAVYEVCEERLKPATVIPGGVEGVAFWHWGETLPKRRHTIPSVVSIGVFDGLHLGHQALLSAAAQDARERGCRFVIMTFQRDPDELFGASKSNDRPFKLESNAERIEALRSFQSQHCADICCELLALPTDKVALAQSAQDFLEYAKAYLNIQAIHVGEGFRFGAKAAGDERLLREWCQENGVAANVHELVCWDGGKVSSTRIRRLVAEGDVVEAARLRCGRMHHIRGKVVRGRGEGTGMGFATANLELEGGCHEVMPPAEGVYACYAQAHIDEDGTPKPVWFGGGCKPAAVNMGVALSFENATAQVEAHILDVDCSLYGATVDLWFVHRLRDQRKFENVDELIKTVTADIQWVRDNLESNYQGVL